MHLQSVGQQGMVGVLPISFISQRKPKPSLTQEYKAVVRSIFPPHIPINVENLKSKINLPNGPSGAWDGDISQGEGV